MDSKLENALKKDPKGRILLEIQEITTDVTDGFAATDVKYIPVYEGYTAYDTDMGSSRVYLIITKGTRVLIYGCETSSIPKSMISPPGGTANSDKFSCLMMEMDSPEDLSVILSQDDDYELRNIPNTTPSRGESNRDFISSNAVWLSNPVLN